MAVRFPSRLFTVLAFADELLACPELITAYSLELGSQQDTRLVIYAPDWDPRELESRLLPEITRVGLDGDDVPEVVAIAVERSDLAEIDIASEADCVYSRRHQEGVFGTITRVDDGGVDVLSTLAREHRLASTRAGIFFVATGARYRAEVAQAVRAVQTMNVTLPITVFTDDVSAFTSTSAAVDDVRAIERPRHSFIDKIEGFLQAPYEHNLFLDTDAFVVGDTEPIFRLLNRFDLVAAHAPGRSGARFHAYESADLPETFPQYNTGVVAFKRSAETAAVFRRWRDIYEANPHHLHDQPSFREAVYESALATHVLPPEWNFLVGPTYLSGPVRIVHGHGLTAQTASSLARRVNQHHGPRLVLASGEVIAESSEAPRSQAVAPSAKSESHNVPARVDIPVLLNRLGLLGAGVEVGVKEGKYSSTVLERWNGRLLFSVDPWLEAPAGDYIDIANVPQERQEKFYAAARERLAPFGERSQIWRMTGDEAAARIPDGSLDFVYLDARHDYASVKSDLEVWYPKVVQGGIIAGHDYVDGQLPEGLFGVRSAVDEFSSVRGLSVGVTTHEPATFPSWIVAVPSRANAKKGTLVETSLEGLLRSG